MNLKEAFQKQNTFKLMLKMLGTHLGFESNVTITIEKHFRSKAANGQSDEELDVTDYEGKRYAPNKAIDLMIFLIEESEKLSDAIRAAKSTVDFDLDSAVDINKKRRDALEVLHKLWKVKSSSLLNKNHGTGYVFNNEGNQTSYKYDVEIVKTIDFDRNKVRKQIKKLEEQADKVSHEIDSVLINTQVDYQYPFTDHVDFADLVENFSN